MKLTDNEFITQFENLSLDTIHFNHIGHLRICWLYLNLNDLQTAIEKTCKGIQSYATNQGATDKFHRTITEFLVRLIHLRIDFIANNTFDEFLVQNKDLVEDSLSVLDQHYSKSLLFSSAARVNYIEPDLSQLT